jgi:hypothetical protein
MRVMILIAAFAAMAIPQAPFHRATQFVRIPAKANAIPEGSRTVFRAEAEHGRSVATLAY